MKQSPDTPSDALEDEQERWQVLTQFEDWLERPMLVLSFIWLSLVIVELVWTTSGGRVANAVEIPWRRAPGM